MIEHAFLKTKVVRRVDEARDGKFSAFRRTDVHLWKRSRLYLAAPLIVPRFLTGIVMMIILLLTSKILFMFGHQEGQALAPRKQKFLKKFTQLVSRVVLFVGPGLWYYKTQKPKVDYAKYLGPDWVPSYENPSTIVANHQSWVDIGMITCLKFPSFTPKLGIKKWPFIGQICDLVFNSYFINRAGTHEEKEKIILDI
jgi:1-acyl-sn-glycerol-3-phosphate acyltransferase